MADSAGPTRDRLLPAIAALAVVLALGLVAERAAQAIDQSRLLAESRSLQARTAQALEAERQARELAEVALRTRDEFLSVAAHELKTPITNLRGYAELTRQVCQHKAQPSLKTRREGILRRMG